jgi:diguanylate cyclase (GGDEF)-like protein
MNHPITDALYSGDGNPALLDTSTGALSRAAFALRLDETAALAVRLGYPVSVMMVDVCRPDALCDIYGDDALDSVLSQMVDRLWGLARRSDTVARVTWARLAVLLPGTDRAGAELYASRLRPSLEAPYRVRDGYVRAGIALTVEGVAHGEPIDSTALLARVAPPL